MPDPAVIYGRDSTLLAIRSLVLKQAGLDSVCRLIDSFADFDPPHTQLVVLCSSISVNDQGNAVSTIKSKLPDTDLLLIQTHPDVPSSYPPGVHLCGPSPEEIVAVCRRLIP
ncbi:MAG: hypothetical protein NVSMB62_20580 [Acidobacteriaceae bacterium]